MGMLVLFIYVKIFIAAICYTTSVIGANTRGLNSTVKALFSTAFVFDLWATYAMYSINPSAPLNPHSIVGFVALAYAGFLQTLILISACSKLKFKNYIDAVFIRHSKIFLLIWYVAVFLGIIAGIMHAKKYYFR